MFNMDEADIGSTMKESNNNEIKIKVSQEKICGSEKERIFFQEIEAALRRPKSKNLLITINDNELLNNLVVRKNIPQTFILKIKNTSQEPITILSVQIDGKVQEVEFKAVCPCKFTSANAWELMVHCKNNGVLYFPILLKLENGKAVEHHAVELVFHVHNEFFDDLHPIEPFQHSPKPIVEKYVDIVEPVPFPITPKLVPLQQYRIPTVLFKILNNQLRPFDGMSRDHQAHLQCVKSLMVEENKRESLTVKKNYLQLLTVLLFMEEHQMLKNIRAYDLADQNLVKAGGLLELQVPNLSEHRPSLLVADTVYIRENKDSEMQYTGVVQKVQESSVLLKFSKRFMSHVFARDKKFYVSFTFNRYCLRVQHRAIDFGRSDNIVHFFFPKRIAKVPISVKLDWFNENISDNPEQMQAVAAILKKSAMPSPYLIFGPPGTGKTVTVVEAVKQIFKRTDERVLICTPSNSAANEITKRLIDTIPSQNLLRYIALSFLNQMPDELKKVSNFDPDGYYQPTMEEFGRYRIVITTLISASKLVSLRCPVGHFSYVFVDEAGQSTESEALVPIVRILSSPDRRGVLSGQIVLAGDPRQLGTVIHSALAIECGFGNSMLERLIDTSPPYQKDASKNYNPCAVTKLLQNYRSHAAIMSLPNKLFYDNELRIAGDETINTAINWKGLPNKNFPLIFHSIVGVEQREKTSPSFFNIQEIQVIVEYLDQLIGSKMQGITINESHILVISPYKQQVKKLRQACDKRGYNGLLIGSVEQVQGQEKLIVIVSTVRSRPKSVKGFLGFLDNPKRFNVAITRARALLIVVGNPNILQLDKYWRSLIEYCKNNGAVIGDEFEFSGEASERNSLVGGIADDAK